MMDHPPQSACVIMGDIVSSESFLAQDELHEVFNRVIDAHNAKYEQLLASPLTITLGDEFQGILIRLADAVPIIQSLRTEMLKASINCRFVIGQIELKSPLNRKSAWNMMGPGLSKARAKLNEKAANTMYRFSLLRSPTSESVLDALGTGLTVIERGWTGRQRDDIFRLMTGETPASLAVKRNVSVHSIYKIRSAGHHDEYLSQWKAIRDLLESLDNGMRLI